MILAIGLCQTDAEADGMPNGNQIIYTELLATFAHEGTALTFADKLDHVMLIDLDTGKILKDANVEVET